MAALQIPCNFEPRHYQQPVFDARSKGVNRFVTTWHRRSGKDKLWLNFTIIESMKRVGSYFYMLPTYSQGRKIIWEGIGKDGFPFMGHIPNELRKRESSQDMTVELKNGSIFRVVGTDQIDRVVGTNPIGIVFSEYSLHDPRAWELMRPVLLENGGFAAFNQTPRGRNHGYKIHQIADKNPEWYCSLLGWKETGVLTQSDIDGERAEGMDEDMIAQEYECSFSAGMRGAYYSKDIELARMLGRIRSVPYDRGAPVFTFWDIGHRDATAIWFIQFIGSEIHAIDYYENHTQGLDHYMGVLLEKPYTYAEHWMPHDAAHVEFGRGRSIKDQAEDYVMNARGKGRGLVEVAPRMALAHGIQSTRKLMPKMFFDESRCVRGIECLENYTKKWDDSRKLFSEKPDHNWASHGADALRTLALSGLEELSFNYHFDEQAGLYLSGDAAQGNDIDTEFDVWST